MNGGNNPIWNDRVFIGFLVASLIGVLVQITMGGAVRVTGSGDGCPDWPLCYGRLIPPFEFHALMEYTHRTIGVIVGLAAIGATLRVLVKHRREAPVATTVTAALVGITITGAIGGAVVLSELSPALRTLHLMLAETVALLLVHATVATFYTRNMSREGSVSNALIIWSAPGGRIDLGRLALRLLCCMARRGTDLLLLAALRWSVDPTIRGRLDTHGAQSVGARRRGAVSGGSTLSHETD